MRQFFCAWVALVGVAMASAQTPDDSPVVSGKVRLQWDDRQASASGPLAQANAWQSGTAVLPTSGAALAAELRASGHHWQAIASILQQQAPGSGAQNRVWFNELFATHEIASWQFSAGKKIVAWDVGYAFRPNDMVQQEERRTLLSTTAEGRPVLMAERFNADTAWSVVLVNPTQAVAQPGAREPALAARFYQRQGAADWHGFARWGAHNGGSVGAAVSWVASDALEVHASARVMGAADSRVLSPLVSGLATSNPWQAFDLGRTTRALLGLSWTHESQLGVLAEVWWDGAAPSDALWANWFARNQMLASQPGLGAPVGAVAGNLAWQADAFGTASSLRRNNVFVRLSWTHENWQPALDLLYHLADGGQMWTAAVLCKGDRVQIQGGVRVNRGVNDSVIGQLPTQRQAYLSGVWSF